MIPFNTITKYKPFLILVVLILAFILAGFTRLPDENNAFLNKINSYIKCINLCDKAVLVKMGADAVTAINTSKGIVVIDAGISYSLTKQYRKQFEKVFSKTYCALLINTHGHPDHTGGNLVFNDAEIVAHVNCIKEMQEQIKNPENVSKNLLKTIESYNNQLKMVDSSSVDWCDAYCQKARYFSAYNDLLEKKQLNFPGLTFTDSLFISMGDVSFDMIYFGKAHSESDILIYVPELKLLFSGDIFTKYGKHHICNADKQLSLRRGHVKKWLQKRKHKIEKIIGGHGEIMSKDDMDAFCKNLVMHEKNPFLYNNIM